MDVHNSPVKVVNFLVTFGPLFEQILIDFQRKRNVKTKMEPKAPERSTTWNLANKSDQHVKQLKESLRQEDNIVAALDTKIIN